MKKSTVQLLITLILSIFLWQSTALAQEDKAFNEWLEALRQEALERGFKPETVDQAFSEIQAPIKPVVKNDRNQAEFVQTYNSYLNARLTDWKTSKGREMMSEHGKVLADIEAAYDIQPRFLVAIWGMETNYGTFPISQPLFNVLATLAYDPRRAKLFRAQFFDALTILESGFPGYERLTSSMAGAMGHTQFLPENYLKYAVDFNGDGHRDIWDSPADALASTANYFRSFGWSSDETWGRKVKLPAELDTGRQTDVAGGVEPDSRCKRYQSLGVWRDLQEWQALGVRRLNGANLPTRSIPAALISADAGDGEGYLVYRNFCTLMRFNPAFKYALSVGLLSDLLVAD